MATNINLPTINMGGTSTAGTGGTTTPFYNPDVITPEQYFSGPVDFYKQTLGTGIQSTVGDETEEEKPEDTAPNIFEPIGGGSEEYKNALQHTLGGGLKPSYDVTMYGVNDLKIDQMSFTPDLTKSAFEDIITNTFTGLENTKGFGKFSETPMATGPLGKPRAVGLPGAVSGMLALTPAAPFAPLAAFFGAVNMAQQARNAAAIKAAGGIAGSFMEVNGTMVSRPPGSLVYGGVMHGLDNKQMSALEAAKRGFVPGTLKAEVFNKKLGPNGAWEQTQGVKSMLSADDMMTVGGTYDPSTGSFVSNLGQSSAMGTKKAAQTLADTFNNMLGSKMSWEDTNAIRSNLEKDIFGNIKTGTKTFQQAYTDAAIKSAMESTGLSRSQLESVVSGGDFVVSGTGVGVNNRGYSTFSDFRGSSEEESDAPDPGPSTPSANATYDASAISGAPSAPAEDPFVGDEYGDNNNDGPSDNSNDGPGGGTSDGAGNADGSVGDGYGGGDARGGMITHGRPQNRNAYAMGTPPAGVQASQSGFAERPEFVGGNQSQPDGVSVADDQPRDVQEGTFVINAAAADFAGRDDIEKMIRDAYKKVGDTGQSGVSQEVAINVSKGEVMIPPHIAKQIGYDRLNKINNRGKKEIARRQEAAGGGFIDRKKFAKGGMPLPKSKPKRVKHSALADVELRADLEEYIQNDPLARLGFNLYEKGDVDVKAIVLPARKPVEVAVGGVYTPKNERRDPGSVARKFEGFANKQGITKQNRDVAAIHYFEGDNVNYGRAEGPLTLLHELRHHAMRHLNQKYKVPLPELSREESMFDAQDYVNRLQARKVKPSIREKPKEKNLEIRQKGMYMSPSANKELAMFQEIAEEVLKDRKVPPRTKSKEVEGFFTRAMRLLGL